jgi:Domain of unknown function (DUF4337)
MSEGHVHVHGPHDHAVEHEAHKTPLGQQVAIFTAVLATVGAIVSFFGGHTQNEALLQKNHAVLKKAEASDQWNYYQAKSMKQNLAELSLSLMTDPAKIEFYKGEVARYAREKKEIETKARALDAESDRYNRLSDEALHPHHKLAVSMTLLQIAIALASITVLTQKRWLIYLAGIAALGGAFSGAIAWL